MPQKTTCCLCKSYLNGALSSGMLIYKGNLLFSLMLDQLQNCRGSSSSEDPKSIIECLTFVIGMDSPVNMDSLTTQVPSINTASHSIMNPPSVLSKITSPGTNSTEDSSISKITKHMVFRNYTNVYHYETYCWNCRS